jgi:outer membrane protein assembly factor BamB
LRGAPAISYVVASDGVLHMVGQAQGKELKKPVPFLPANANATDLLAAEEMLFTTTVNNCGGVPNGVWAMNLETGAVSSWKTGASPAGPVAMSPSGTLYVAIGDGTAAAGAHSDAVVALDPATLAVKDWFAMPGASFSTSPVIFEADGKEMVAAATKDGRVFLLDAASLGGSDHKTALGVSSATTTSKTFAPSALATWEDAAKTRWVLLASSGSATGITALKMNGHSFAPGWTASVASPSAPIVVNGVVFALNTGSGAAPATLYAFDGENGSPLWNSGKAMTAGSRAGLWSVSGQVYVATADAMLYAFGTSQGR